MEPKVTCIHFPQGEELLLCQRCMRVTLGKADMPEKPLSTKTLRRLLQARHSPIRVLTFAFLLEGIPSNTATHFCRHVHALPFVSSLRNDRQGRLDGDKAPRNTPVDMILVVNAEELMTMANKRLCRKAAPNTRRWMQSICAAALRVLPALEGLLVPMCDYHGGLCDEIDGCGYAPRRWE